MKKKIISIIAALSIISASIWIYVNYENTVKEQKTENAFGDNPVYIAMKDRFPDSLEETEYFDGNEGGKLRVSAANSENQNYLELTITIDERLDRVPAYTICFLDSGKIALQQKYNFLADYIAETDCLEYVLDPDYVHPKYYGPVH